MSRFKLYTKSILIPVIIGGIVGFIISNSIDYNSLQKPILAPPGIIFQIIWTMLYILMGVSYGILKEQSLVDSKTKLIYYAQLFVNALWSIIFFTLKLRLFAFLWIIILDAIVIAMIINFYQKNKLSGLLQLPYLIWTVFASYLNLSIYLLNN